jgi:hypothetical protein
MPGKRPSLKKESSEKKGGRADSVRPLVADEAMPSKQMVAQLLRVLREAGILKPVREASGRRAQVLALAELVNLCEGREVVV